MKTSGFSSKLVVFSTLLGLSTSFTVSAPEMGKAKVTGVIGSALVGGEAARVGMPVITGTVLSTGSDSQLDLFLDDNGPDVHLLSDSRLTIDELSVDYAGPEKVIKTKLGLQAGRVQGTVKRTSDLSTYVVQTPTATASVRGTRYLVGVDGSVYVWDGAANVLFRGINYNVGDGQMFDPGIPGVRDSDMTEPPIAYAAAVEVIVPVGPVQSVSPIAPVIPTFPGTGD
jgi:hypothetical protein